MRLCKAFRNKFIIRLCDLVDKELLCLKMDDVARLFGLSFCMFVGCYVAGAIPLAFTMSEVSLSLERFRCFCDFIFSDKVTTVPIAVGNE